MNRPPPKAKLEVLLVEDSIEEVYLVRGLLDKTDLFQVTTSQDGDQAARLIKEHEFQLVITDLNLPGKDGYELIRLVKETSPDVPVIATTGYTAPHYHEQAYRTGADDLAVKPLDRDDFLKKVLAAVGMEAELAPRTSVVLAIGALPGDVEGRLWRHAFGMQGSRRWRAHSPPQRIHRGWRSGHRGTESCRCADGSPGHHHRSVRDRSG